MEANMLSYDFHAGDELITTGGQRAKITRRTRWTERLAAKFPKHCLQVGTEFIAGFVEGMLGKDGRPTVFFWTTTGRPAWIGSNYLLILEWPYEAHKAHDAKLKAEASAAAASSTS